MDTNELDDAYGITDKLAVAMEKTVEKMAEKVVEGAEMTNEVKENVIGNIVKGARAFIYRFSGHDVFRY